MTMGNSDDENGEICLTENTQMAKVIDTQSQEIRSQAKQIEALRQENAEMKAQIAAILAKLDK